ncbi:unnamed protein product, partial [Sphacelaria rigidula]
MSGSADEEQNVTVAIRLRPLNDREKAGNQGTIWRCVPSHNSVTQTTPEGNPLPDAKGSTFFTYDRIFDERSSTQEVYDGVARGLVNSVIRGLNSTIFAYGQTSSGKTFTMQGGDNTYDSPGIVQMATRDLFSRMEETRDRVFLMRASYLEIYQEDIRDLLVPDPTVSKLQVREDPRKGVYIDAHEEVLGDFDHVLRVLAHGEQRRHVGCTEMNSRSSRSHTIFRLVVESQQQYVPGIHASEEDVDPAVFVATLNLVDLAGSESVRHTGATGLRQKEGGNINRSLLTLSQVIQKLSQGGTSHVNYRDSKLTRILQPSLSGNASMAIICCATPAEGFLEETRSTFQFASRAKQIKTRAVVNEVLDDKAQLRRMSKELAALRQQHAEPAALQGKLETLEAEKAEQAAKIERLGNLIINIANRPAAVAGAAAALHVDISPRTRRTKRSRETWCPGKGEFPILQVQGLGAAADRMSTLLEEDDADYRLKRRSGVEAIAAELKKAEEEREEMKAELDEFCEYTVQLMQEMSAAEFQLVQEKDAAARAAREAADAVAAATEAAEAAAARESEATATLRAKLAALEAEREENEEEMAELRALNAEAAALLADNQDRRVMQMDGEAQTDALEGVTGGTSEEDAVAGMAERDRALVALQSRIEELEGSISQAESQRHELDARTREEREETEAALREAVAGQRRAEDALSLANQSQLEMRCRLEEAVQQVKEAETMRGEMEVAAEVLNSNKDNRIAMLIGRVSEIELEKEAAVQAQASSAALKEKTEAAAASTAEEASRMREELEALRADAEAKGTNIAELEDHVSCLKAAGEEQAELEAEVQSLRGVHQQMLSEKEEKEAQLETGMESLEDEHKRLLSETEDKDANVGALEAALASAQANHEAIAQVHDEKQAAMEEAMQSLKDEHQRLLSATEDKDAEAGELKAALAAALSDLEAIVQARSEKQA